MIFHLLTEETLKEKKFQAEKKFNYYDGEVCNMAHDLSPVKGSSLPITAQKFSFLK